MEELQIKSWELALIVGTIVIKIIHDAPVD
jgi:hypothetical protein